MFQGDYLCLDLLYHSAEMHLVTTLKSKKLLKFTLDDGEGERIILSGIAEYYAPEELVGKNIAYVANLAPRKMMGIESCGMILSAESGDGLKVVTIDDSILPGGSLV